jgi:hypothetical protein
MNDLFALLALFGLIGLVVGLIKPTLFRIKSRKNALYIFGGLTVIFFILFGVTSPSTQTSTTTPVAIKSSEQTPLAPQVPLTDEEKIKNAVAPLLEQSSLKASYDQEYSYLASDDENKPSNKQQDVYVGIDTGLISDDSSYITESGTLTASIFQQVFSINPNFVHVLVAYRGLTTDSYGHSTTTQLMGYSMDRALYNKINWAGISSVQNDVHMCAFLRQQSTGIGSTWAPATIAGSGSGCSVFPYDLRNAESAIENANPQYQEKPLP